VKTIIVIHSSNLPRVSAAMWTIIGSLTWPFYWVNSHNCGRRPLMRNRMGTLARSRFRPFCWFWGRRPLKVSIMGSLYDPLLRPFSLILRPKAAQGHQNGICIDRSIESAFTFAPEGRQHAQLHGNTAVAHLCCYSSHRQLPIFAVTHLIDNTHLCCYSSDKQCPSLLLLIWQTIPS